MPFFWMRFPLTEKCFLRFCLSNEYIVNVYDVFGKDVEMKRVKTSLFFVTTLCLLLLSGRAWAIPSYVPTNGLISYWAFDEGSASTAYDSMNGNDGTIYGATWTTGVVGGALDFDGVDDYVNTGKSLLNNLSQFTLAGWIYPESTGIRIGFFGQNDMVEFGFLSSSQMNGWNPLASGVVWGITNSTFPLNEWHHVALVGNGSLMLYVDGEFKKTSGSSVSNFGTSGYDFKIGGEVYLMQGITGSTA